VRRRPSAWQGTVVAIAASIGLSIAVFATAAGVPVYEAPSIATSIAIMLSPFAVLASAPRPRWPAVWVGALVLLTAGTGWGIWVSGSSSTGGLVFLWLVPLEAGVAALGAVRPRESEPLPPTAGWYPDPARQARWRWWDGWSWTAYTA
jgi:hypothetical protein